MKHPAKHIGSPFSSVRFRLTLWNIGVLAMVLFVFLAVVHVSVRSYLLSEIDRRLTGMAEQYVEMISDTRSGKIPPGPPMDKRHKRHFPVTLRQYDLKGRSTRPTGKLADVQERLLDKIAFKRAASGESVFSYVTENDAPLRVFSRPIEYKDHRVGVVQIAASFAEVKVMLESLTMTLTILVPVALLVAGVGGLFLTSRALKPLRQMVKSASAISDSDLSRRIPVIGADEFAHLAATINGMLARLDKAFLQLRQAFERERRFTSDASHELRTPLTAIKANTSLTLRGERTPEQYREALTNIDQSADTMSRLVQDLLLLARSDGGQLSRDFQAVDPRKLFEQAAATVRRSENDAKVRIDAPQSAGMIYGDPEHLNRLVINLLENALRYTPSGGEVLLQASGNGDSVALTVSDTGEGIAAEHLPHLCERFYRVDQARAKRSGGSGLGLAICRSIVDAHSGSMVIESVVGQGTRVIITLPAVV
ncbi:MAG: ATP-binding protein [Armatimonadota bacterium]|nr:HAMP domain-containing protein [bacterium]